MKKLTSLAILVSAVLCQANPVFLTGPDNLPLGQTASYRLQLNSNALGNGSTYTFLTARVLGGTNQTGTIIRGVSYLPGSGYQGAPEFYANPQGSPNFDPSADLNHDGWVDSLDYRIVYDAFDSVNGDPNWNPNADANNDGVVDLSDYVMVLTSAGPRANGVLTVCPPLQDLNFGVTRPNPWTAVVTLTVRSPSNSEFQIEVLGQDGYAKRRINYSPMKAGQRGPRGR